MKNLSINMRAIVLVLFAFLCFNIADAFLNAVVDSYHFGTTGFYPILSYLFFLLVFSKQSGGIKSLRQTTHLKMHLFRGILSTIGFISFILAITYLTLAQTYTLVLTTPFWVALASIIVFKKWIGWHRGLAIMFGFSGVLIALQPDAQNVYLLGSVAAITCALSAAGSMITAKMIGDKEPMINMIFFPLTVTITTMVLINSFWQGWQPITIEHAIFFIAAGATFLIADFLFVGGFRSGETDLLAPLHYSQILWGALIGYFFFQEIPETRTYYGATVIVLSGLYLIYREHKVSKK
jgi:S-adenosylmethionine uptake transporter